MDPTTQKGPSKHITRLRTPISSDRMNSSTAVDSCQTPRSKNKRTLKSIELGSMKNDKANNSIAIKRPCMSLTDSSVKSTLENFNPATNLTSASNDTNEIDLQVKEEINSRVKQEHDLVVIIEQLECQMRMEQAQLKQLNLFFESVKEQFEKQKDQLMKQMDETKSKYDSRLKKADENSVKLNALEEKYEILKRQINQFDGLKERVKKQKK